MMETALISTIIVMIMIVAFSRRRRASVWATDLKRLHPGVSGKAEWMAPDDIVRSVELDYMEAQRWMTEVLLSGYTRYIREASDYFIGNYLKAQQRHAVLQMRKRGPRLIGILRAHHYVRVRHFSDDGLSCLLVDHQTERRMATYDYWHLRRLHTQDLGEGAYVYRMIYDRAAKHWKIEELIQQLPSGWEMV